MKQSLAPLVLNGSYGEGGSALFRAAIVMSCLTQQAVRVHNIRGATRRPGLTSEDLTFLKVLEKACTANVSGAEPHGNDVTFVPTTAPLPAKHRVSVTEHEKGQVFGNGCIVAEAVLPVLARAGGYSTLIIEGETFNTNTLSYDAFEMATLRVHRKQGLYAFPRLEYAGFGHAGYGEFAIDVEPSAFGGLMWTKRGELRSLSAIVSYCDAQASFINRIEEQLKLLMSNRGLTIDVERREVSSKGRGTFITLVGEFENGLGSSGVLIPGGSRADVAVGAVHSAFMDWFRSDATLDPYLADQILIPAALSDEPTQFTTSLITPRLLTLSWVIKQFLPVHLTVLGREGEAGTVKVSRA